MAMTVGELITKLENLNDETRLAVAYQPHYPKTESVTNVVAVDGVLYIAGSPRSDYLEERVRKHLDWDDALAEAIRRLRAGKIPDA